MQSVQVLRMRLQQLIAVPLLIGVEVRLSYQAGRAGASGGAVITSGFNQLRTNLPGAT